MYVITSINGRMVERGQDKISVFDNALLYAEGLFETFLAIGGSVVFADDHLRRLFSGAKVIGLEIPATPERLARWMARTLRAHPDRIKKLRLTITSGEAARWVGRQGKPQVILSASSHTMPKQAFRLHLSEFRVDQDSVFRHIKTLSYAIHAAALKQARDRGCDDALLLNQKGQVAEVTSANVYWVRASRIYTPPLSAGCLEGVTRRAVVTEAGKLGLRVAERGTTLEAMVTADEVFISSSLKLIVGVSHVKAGRRTHKLSTGPVTDQLASHFRRLVGLS